jgi:hypothetical protein
MAVAARCETEPVCTQRTARKSTISVYYSIYKVPEEVSTLWNPIAELPMADISVNIYFIILRNHHFNTPFSLHYAIYLSKKGKMHRSVHKRATPQPVSYSKYLCN